METPNIKKETFEEMLIRLEQVGNITPEVKEEILAKHEKAIERAMSLMIDVD